LVRVTVNTMKPPAPCEDHRNAAHVRRARPSDCDFHYNGHLLLKKYPDMARALSKYRINRAT